MYGVDLQNLLRVALKFTLFSIVYGVLLVFHLCFKGPYHNIGICSGNALIVRDSYGLFLHSSHFSVLKVEAFLSHLG